MAALSRQMNAFFAIYLPTLCATEFPNVYTVFAGGDDFFMIGPWYKTQELAARMATEFKRYVADNTAIHFSAGMTMTKAGQPIYGLAHGAEEALGLAKGAGKNAVQLFGQTVPWAKWEELKKAEARLDELRRDYNLSTGFVYSMLQLIDLSEQKDKPEAAMWRSKLAYRTARFVGEKFKGDANRDKRQRAQAEIVQALGDQGIAALKGNYRIPLFNHFYRQR
jgi:CRISPR-associated protein Csm1